VAAFASVDTTAKVVIELKESKDLIGDFVMKDVVFLILPIEDDAKRQVAVTSASNVVGSQQMTNSSTTTRYRLLVGNIIILTILVPL
jgi:hypothetical protein